MIIFLLEGPMKQIRKHLASFSVK